MLAVYAEPLFSVEQGALEMLAFRRLTKAKFPFLVSANQDFSLRSMGIPSPQVVLLGSHVVTHVLDLPDEFKAANLSMGAGP